MGYNPTVTIFFGGQTEKAHSSNDVINQSRGTHWVLHVHKGKPTMLSSCAGTDQFYQLGCDLVQGQDKINIACFDGRLRHAEILRTGPVLHDDHAALLLDDLHPEGTIGFYPIGESMTLKDIATSYADHLGARHCVNRSEERRV